MNNNIVLNISNLNVDIGQTHILKNINFKVFAKSIHGFIGPNGAGKSTTIKTILNAIPKTSGKIQIHNKDNDLGVSKDGIGYVPEALKFNKNKTVKRVFYEYSILSGIPMREIKEKIAEFKNSLINIEIFWKRPLAKLSSGQQKLIIMVYGLIREPNLLILDEPMENLDPTYREKLYKFMNDFVQKKNNAIFISSHVLDELETICDTITILKDGQIIYTGKKDASISEFEKNLFFIKVNNNEKEKVLKLLVENKIEILKNNVDGIFFRNKMFKNSNEFAKFVIGKKIIFETIGIKQETLRDIYSKYVIKE